MTEATEPENGHGTSDSPDAAAARAVPLRWLDDGPPLRPQGVTWGVPWPRGAGLQGSGRSGTSGADGVRLGPSSTALGMPMSVPVAA